MNTQKYLDRLKIDRNISIDVSLRTLKLIQKQHLLTIPFENLDIHINDSLKTDIKSLYKKIVTDKRGGICYELNWLLFHLLKNIGFDVRVVGGMVLEDNGSFFDHMLLLVNINYKQYLVDVGFGNNFLEPLEFELDIIQKDKKGLFKILEAEDKNFKLMKFSQETSTFKTEYIFKNHEKFISDFENRMHYFINSEESIFKKNIFCSLEMETGRISLKHDKFILTKDDVKSVEKINSSIEYLTYLNDRFKIHLNVIDNEKIRKIWRIKNEGN